MHRRTGKLTLRWVPGHCLRRVAGSGEAWSCLVTRAEGGASPRPSEAVAVAARPVSWPSATGETGRWPGRARATRTGGLPGRALVMPLLWRRAAGRRTLGRHGVLPGVLGAAVGLTGEPWCPVRATRADLWPAREARASWREGRAAESRPRRRLTAGVRGDDPAPPLKSVRRGLPPCPVAEVRSRAALTAVFPRASAARPGVGVGCRPPAPAP